MKYLQQHSTIVNYSIFLALIMFLLFLVHKILIRGGGGGTEGFVPLHYEHVPPLYNAGNETHAGYNYAKESVLLSDIYPLKWSGCVNFEDQWKKWWHYPTFKVGSYKQITNNIRYPNNPDVATSTPTLFSGALYKEMQYKTNYSESIPPVNVDVNKVRINYYNSEPNMLPYVSDLPNILY